jgi:hypothetical protein
MRVAGPREKIEPRYGVVPGIERNVTSLAVRWRKAENANAYGPQTLRVSCMSEFYYCSYVTG